MKLKTTLAAMALVLGSASAANAATYSVTGIFNEPMTADPTQFVGTFDWNWDSNTNTGLVSNFKGTMNESMQGPWVSGSSNDYMNFGTYTSIGSPTDMWPTQNTYKGQLNYLGANGMYMLNLDQNLIQNDTGSLVTASIFKENTSDVYYGGGYTNGEMSGFAKFGGSMGMMMPAIPGEVANENAFFTLAFTHDGMGNITSLGLQTVGANAALVNQMQYGDCTVGSLMGSTAAMCMAGEPTGSSMMMGTASSIEINQVAAVPVPAAVWLFGGALMSLFGVNRRKSVLPA